MKRVAQALVSSVLALCALAPAAARAGERACAACRYAGDLSALFVPARQLGPGWETLAEAPVDPTLDPDLRDAGVEAIQSLHYTHELKGGAEVCSVEIWSFATPAKARLALSGIERAGWRFSARGNLLLMLRGVTLRRGERLRPGLLPVCQRLAGLIEAHVEELLPEPAPARAE